MSEAHLRESVTIEFHLRELHRRRLYLHELNQRHGADRFRVAEIEALEWALANLADQFPHENDLGEQFAREIAERRCAR